ncbi:indolepyruvate oxidoreductase subunit beta [Desulfothermus okinawensis JCM 13304]
MNKMRIFLAGVGGQGTLTATNLISLIALDKNIDVTSGEIHGMAQRGGIVESTVLLGGYLSPKIDLGEADMLLGFEPVETLRALKYLKKGGTVVWNTNPTYPVGVSTGMEKYPEMDYIEHKINQCADKTYKLPCIEIADKAGTTKCANMVLLGAFFSIDVSPFTLIELEQGIKKYMSPKIQEINIKAARLGSEAFSS